MTDTQGNGPGDTNTSNTRVRRPHYVDPASERAVEAVDYPPPASASNEPPERTTVPHRVPRESLP